MGLFFYSLFSFKLIMVKKSIKNRRYTPGEAGRKSAIPIGKYSRLC